MARISYWSCSDFVGKIRNMFGPKKPNSATAEGWREWRIAFRRQSPFIYWLTETGVNKLQNFIFWPIDKIDSLYYAVNARFRDRYFGMSSDLDKWRYHEIDDRILHCNFQTLVDFVEIESAHQVTWAMDKEEEKERRKKYGIKWYHRNRWASLFAPKWRSKLAGMDHFEWECNLRIDESHFGYRTGEMPEEEKAGIENFGELTGQAKAAIETRDLYLWWTEVRPNRPDPMEASGYDKYFELAKAKRKARDGDDYDELDFLLSDGVSIDLKSMRKEASAKMHDIEQAYEKEDEEMLIKLMKMRRCLWT